MFRKLFNRNNQSANKEFERAMASLPSLSQETLEEMHDILLTYATKSIPWTLDALTPEEYLKREAELDRTPIANGGVFGCRTYGEARKMNKVIVSRLDELEG